jgi:hypothetical protein
MTAPSGTTPWVANRHKPINSFRASATTTTLRTRRPVLLDHDETSRIACGATF